MLDVFVVFGRLGFLFWACYPTAGLGALAPRSHLRTPGCGKRNRINFDPRGFLKYNSFIPGGFMEFRVGEKVVYPNHGVGIIEEVTRRPVNGVAEEFYMLRIHSNASLVMVPITNVKSVGLRRIIKKADVEGLFKLLDEDFFEPESDWKGRYKDHSEKMRTGSIFQVAEVLRNLVYLSFKKSLSFREKRMLDRAKQLIISEVATVRGLSEKLVEEQIDRALSHAYERSVKASA
jgi:CarD family transcriptional regulator